MKKDFWAYALFGWNDILYHRNVFFTDKPISAHEKTLNFA